MVAQKSKNGGGDVCWSILRRVKYSMCVVRLTVQCEPFVSVAGGCPWYKRQQAFDDLDLVSAVRLQSAYRIHCSYAYRRYSYDYHCIVQRRCWENCCVFSLIWVC